MIKADIALRIFITTVISFYMVKGLGCLPAVILCQQISLGAQEQSFCFPVVFVCEYVCVLASAKDLQIVRRAPEFIYRLGVTGAQGQQQPVTYC